MPNKVFNFTFTSGSTGTNKQFVGPHVFAHIVTSAMTGWNSGTGNATISLRGGLSATDQHADIQSCSVATHTIKGVHPMPYRGLPYMSLGLGSLPTGSGATSSIDVVVYTDDAADG